MAYLARVSFTGNASTTQYSLPFTYIVTTHIKCFLDNTETALFSVSGSVVTFNSAPASGVAILIKRVTPTDARLVDFQDGSVLTESDLDKSADQNFNIAQESSDTAQLHLGLDNSDKYDAGSKQIISVADPTTAQGVATKNYIESTWLSSSDKTNLTAVAAVSSEMALLGVSGVITDMGILGTADVVSDMNTLGTADIVSDMNTLATSDVVSDMNTLATSAIVTDMDLLGTSANVTAMGLLGNATSITNMGLLGVSGVITDMGILGTADVVSDLNTLATSDVVSDMNTLASSAIVTDMDILATSANVTAMGLLGTSANVTAMGLLGTSGVITDMGLLGTSAVITDMGLLGTSAVVTDMDLLGTSANVTNMATLGASGVVTNIATVATNVDDVNNFADQYKIASSAPSSPSEGDLWYDSTNNILKVHNGSSFVAVTSATAGITDVVDDTTPQLGGDLSLNGNNIDFPTTANISDCLDEDTMSSNSATKLATQQSIKAYVDAVEASDITTVGTFFSNWNTVNANTTTTLTTAKNRFLAGAITVADTYTWDVAGSGELTII